MELIDETLTVLSQLYAADVTAMVRRIGSTLRLTNACGIPESDPAYIEGWPLAGAAAEALTTGRVVARTDGNLDPVTDLPPSMADLAADSAVWVPVGEAGKADELLVMYRINQGGFPGVDLPVLASVAARLGLAVEDRRRSAAVESLATFGHRLTSRLDLPSLFEEVVRLLPLLVDADAAGVVRIDGEVAYLTAATTTGMPAADHPIPVEALPGWLAVRAGEVSVGRYDEPVIGRGTLLVVPPLSSGHRGGDRGVDPVDQGHQRCGVHRGARRLASTRSEGEHAGHSPPFVRAYHPRSLLRERRDEVVLRTADAPEPSRLSIQPVRHLDEEGVVGADPEELPELLLPWEVRGCPRRCRPAVCPCDVE